VAFRFPIEIEQVVDAILEGESAISTSRGPGENVESVWYGPLPYTLDQDPSNGSQVAAVLESVEVLSASDSLQDRGRAL
jgi:hypothetical protein